MAGLDPAIHVFSSASPGKTWVTGSSPVMTIVGGEAARCLSPVVPRERGPILPEPSMVVRVRVNSFLCHHDVRWLWVPACAGTTIEYDATACVPSTFRFNFQTARTSMRSRALRELGFVTRPSGMRGMERRKAQMYCLASLCEKGSASPHGAPSAAILGEGSALPGQDGRFHAPIRRLSPRSCLSASSHSRRGHVVGPVADPSLPDATGANRARRRRASFHFRIASRSAPHE
jgi:hypothetical protein